MHLAVVEIDLHVGDPVSGQDALGAGGLNTLFDRGDEDPVDIGADQALLEFHSRIPRGRLDAHPDFAELAGSTRLLLVPVFRFGLAVDGLPIRHARFGEFDLDVEASFEAFDDDLKVQFALAGNRRSGAVRNPPGGGKWGPLRARC